MAVDDVMGGGAGRGVALGGFPFLRFQGPTGFNWFQSVLWRFDRVARLARGFVSGSISQPAVQTSEMTHLHRDDYLNV